MYALFIREMKTNFKSWLIWMILSVLLIVIAYWEYGAIDDTAAMGQIFTSFPQIASVMFGLTPLGMEDIIGYAGLMQYYIYFIGVAYAFILGNKLIQKELDDQTAEFLFTKPIKRQTIFKVKASVGTIYIFLFNILVYLANIWQMTSIGDSVYSNDEIVRYMAVSQIGLFLFMLSIFMIALAGNIVFANKRTGVIITGVFITYSYVTYILIQSFEKLNDLVIISPWRYFSMDLIVLDEVKIGYAIILFAIAAIAKAVAYYRIENKQF